MYEDMIKQSYAQFEQTLAPARKFAGLSVDHAEKLASFQIDAAKSYVDFSVEQLRGALSVNDPKSLQEYVGKQQDAVSTFSRKVTDDVETLAGFGKDFSEAATKLAQENVATTRNASAPKARKSA